MALDLDASEFKFLLNRMERGDVVLFLGAGFSVDARNRFGERPPLAGSLAKILAAEAGFPYADEPLPAVYQAARSHLGNTKLFNLLYSLYQIETVAPWYQIVSSLVWYRIYTTNIDNLLDRLYRKDRAQRLRTVVCPAPPEDRDVHFSDLQLVHLHGHVDHLHDKGIVFSLQDFAGQTVEPNPWYISLAADLYERPIVFIGSLAEEPALHHYVELRGAKSRMRNYNEHRGKSYLVNPTIGPIRSANLREQNIVAVECSGQEFFQAVQNQLSTTAVSISVSSVRAKVFPHAFGSPWNEPQEVVRWFDPIRAECLPKCPPTLPHNFFLGSEATWDDIQVARDAGRELTDLLVEEVSVAATEFRCFMLHGSAGSGKSTVLKRAAVRLAESGMVVYFAKQEHMVKLDGIIAAARAVAQENVRLVVFIDNMSRHLHELRRLMDGLLKCNNVSLILADRTNTLATREHAIEPLNPRKLRLGDLVVCEVERILDRLERFQYLGALKGKTREACIDEFMSRANKQLLVAMKETTSGKGFVEILRDEFRELPPQAQLAYVICCMAVAQGSPGVYKRHLFPCFERSAFTKLAVLEDVLRGVLVEANETGTLLAPRHRIIATEVVDNIASQGTKVEALTKYLRQISSEISPTSIRQRSPTFRSYRGLVNSEGMKRMFGGDSEIIIGIYEELRGCYDGQFLFWLHFAMAYMMREDYEIAENYLNQAKAICEKAGANPFQILHQQGILYLIQASRCSPAIAGEERAKDGISILKQLINERGDEDSYPFNAYTEYVTRWYAHAGRLIPDDEWEALRKTAQLATTKYALDEIALENRKKVERAYLMRVAIDKADDASG